MGLSEWASYYAGMPLAEGSSDVKVAVVTTIGVVVAAGLTALATTLQRDKTPPQPATTGTPSTTEVLVQQYIAGLESDRDQKQKDLDAMRVLHGKLRDACWERGLDPDDLIAGQ